MKAIVRTTCWLALGLLGLSLGRLALPEARSTQAITFFKQVVARVDAFAMAMDDREPASGPAAPGPMTADTAREATSPRQAAMQQRRVRDRMAELEEKLGLDAVQVAKLRPIMELAESSMNRAMKDWFSSRDGNGNDGETPPPDDAIRKSHELADTQITALLRPEQEEKFQAWVQERKEHVRHLANRRNPRPPGEVMPPPVQDA